MGVYAVKRLRLRLSDWGWDLEFQGVGFGVQVLGSKV